MLSIKPNEHDKHFQIAVFDSGVPDLETLLTETDVTCVIEDEHPLAVIGLAELGLSSDVDSYDDCYGEDKDKQIDVMLHGHVEAVKRMTTVIVPAEGSYLPLHNPGGPGHVTIALDDPMTISYGIDLRKLDLINEGKATQTTTEGKAYARYAGDGDPDQASCTQLQEGENKAKWRVDFNNVKKIQRIILLDANKYPLNNIVLEILDNNDQVVVKKEITEATKETDEKSNRVLKYKFAFDGVDGHAVRIQKTEKGRLALAEVEACVFKKKYS